MRNSEDKVRSSEERERKITTSIRNAFFLQEGQEFCRRHAEDSAEVPIIFGRRLVTSALPVLKLPRIRVSCRQPDVLSPLLSSRRPISYCTQEESIHRGTPV